MIKRLISGLIRKDFNKGKIIVLLGARQVGKTTLLNELVHKKQKVLSLNCDYMDDRFDIEGKSPTELRQLLQPYDVALIDEVQRVNNIGLTLKVIADMKLDTQVVVTGSSSLDIANQINESATGRLYEYKLYPFSLQELAAHTTPREEQRLLEQRLIYGLYPEVVTHPEDTRRTLTELTNSYLYKDLLSSNGIKKPDLLLKLVKVLALQLGSEVSYNELAGLIGANKQTVEAYIRLLEQCFVVFQLDSYSRNLRNEIKKGKKIYFYDNGVRNAILSAFAPLDSRNDVGMLWENLMISERVKHNAYNRNYANLYFWRTHEQKEIDLIEEQDGMLHAYEFKWNPEAKAPLPKAFAESYPNSTFKVIHPKNFWEFV